MGGERIRPGVRVVDLTASAAAISIIPSQRCASVRSAGTIGATFGSFNVGSVEYRRCEIDTTQEH